MAAPTKEFLEGIGIQLDDQTYAAFSTHFEDTLFDRIIDSIIETLNDGQVDELRQSHSVSGEQLWQWVQANVPDLGEIVQEEIDILLGELAEHSDSI